LHTLLQVPVEELMRACLEEMKLSELRRQEAAAREAKAAERRQCLELAGRLVSLRLRWCMWHLAAAGLVLLMARASQALAAPCMTAAAAQSPRHNVTVLAAMIRRQGQHQGCRTARVVGRGTGRDTHEQQRRLRCPA
jgi:hypothetical protein